MANKKTASKTATAAQQSHVTNEPAAPKTDKLSEQNAELLRRLDESDKRQQELMLALIAAKQVATPTTEREDEALYRVENVCGATLSFTVPDSRTGALIPVQLERRGDYRKLTKAQILDLKEKVPSFFENGYLSSPDVVDDGPNVIRDLDAYIKEMPYEAITETIDKITAISVLFELYNHIENQRFEHADENGVPFTEKDQDGKDVMILKETRLDSKTMGIEIAVTHRIKLLSGVVASLNG